METLSDGQKSFTAIVRAVIELQRTYSTPLSSKAMTQPYTTIFFLTDGQLGRLETDRQALAELLDVPAQIVQIGVGDGPFTYCMEMTQTFSALAQERKRKRRDAQGCLQFVQVSDYVSPGEIGKQGDGDPVPQEIALAGAVFAAAARRIIDWRERRRDAK